MTLDDFLVRLNGVKKLQRGSIARCPAHDDRTPSLSVCEKDGRILVHCHAGCEPKAILSAMGLEFRHLFTEEREPGSGSKNRIEREYIYRDATWKEAYRILRYGSKHFPVGRFEGSEWRDGLGGNPKLLYKLPELLAQPERTVYLVEGEKDVETLIDHGLVATCNPFGAGKFLPEHAEVLRGRNVVIVQDRDDPGRKHGAQVFQMLQGVAASVRLVEAKVGKDASDHFDAGYDADEFIEAGSAAVRAVCMQDVEPEEVEWLWHPYIPRGEPTLLGGDGGIAKTYIALAIAAALSNGHALPGAEAMEPRSVIFVTAEDDIAKTLAPRFRKLGGDPSKLHVLELDTIEEAGEDWLDVTIAEVKRHRAVLVVFDPLQAFSKAGADINKIGMARAEMRRFRRVGRETGATQLVIVHLNKMVGGKAQYRINGSVDLVNAARSVMLAGKIEKDGEEFWAVGHAKSNYAARGATWRYEVGDQGFRWLGPVAFTVEDISCGEQKSGKLSDAAAFLQRTLESGALAEPAIMERAKAEGFSRATVRRAKKLLNVRSKREGIGWVWEIQHGQEAQRTPVEDDEHLAVAQVQKETKSTGLFEGDEHLGEEEEIRI